MIQGNLCVRWCSFGSKAVAVFGVSRVLLPGQRKWTLPKTACCSDPARRHVAGGSATAVAEAEIAVRGKVRTHWGLLVKSPLKPDALAESCTESCRLQMPEV